LETKKARNINTLRIRKMISGKPIEDILEMMHLEQPVEKEEECDQMELYFKSKLKNHMRTISTHHGGRRTAEKRHTNREKEIRRSTNEIEEVRKSERSSRQERNDSITLDHYCEPEEKERKQRLKVNFEKYFTLHQSLECKNSHKLAHTSLTARPPRSQNLSLTLKPKICHRYSSSAAPKSLSKASLN
jgi:hypothetical protein